MVVTQAAPVRADLGYALYDADQHYYEPEDAVTRHLERAYRYAVRWIDMDGRRTLLVNDRLLKLVPNPTYDPVGRPGALSEYFRARNQAGRSLRDILGELQPIQPEYRDRGARVARLDEQGVEFAWLLPSLGLGLEEMLSDDLPALTAVVRAYNQWLDDDWGYDRDARIQTAPLLCLGDPEAAESELARVVKNGARLVVMRPAPVVSICGMRSLGDAAHDRVWAMAGEAGVVVAFHAADSGYGRYTSDWGESARFGGVKMSPFEEILSIHIHRPIFDTLAALVSHGVFDRHPRLKVATVELGAGWLPYLFERMGEAYGKSPQSFERDPLDAFREHVWVTPFYEDAIAKLVTLLGADHVLMGSDWPHPEGLPTPAAFADDVATLPTDARRRILRDNLRALVGHA
jgi:predicted TIM-barrel fold metal-dependent hydrolase